MAGGVLVISCAGPVDNRDGGSDGSLPSSKAFEAVARTFAGDSVTDKSAEAGSLSASITDVVEGGVSGEWGVSVDFPAGCGCGCIIDVINLRSGDLLARDSVSGAEGEAYSHMVRFRHKGRGKDLRVRVLESCSGSVLAEVAHR